MQKICAIILLTAFVFSNEALPQTKWSRPITESPAQLTRERRQFPFGEWVPLSKPCPTCRPLTDSFDIGLRGENIGLVPPRPQTVTRQIHGEGNFFSQDESSILSVPPPPPNGISGRPTGSGTSVNFDNLQFQNFAQQFNGQLTGPSQQIFSQNQQLPFLSQQFLSNQPVLVNGNSQILSGINSQNVVFGQDNQGKQIINGKPQKFNSEFKQQKLPENIVIEQNKRPQGPKQQSAQLEFSNKPFAVQDQRNQQQAFVQQQSFRQQPLLQQQQHSVNFADSILSPPPVPPLNSSQDIVIPGLEKEEIQLLYVPVETLRQKGTFQEQRLTDNQNIQFGRPAGVQRPVGGPRPTEQTTTKQPQGHFVTQNGNSQGPSFSTQKLTTSHSFPTTVTPSTLLLQNLQFQQTPQPFVSATPATPTIQPFVTPSSLAQKFTSFTSPETTLSHLSTFPSTGSSFNQADISFGTTPKTIFNQQGLQEEIINGKTQFSGFKDGGFQNQQFQFQQGPANQQKQEKIRQQSFVSQTQQRERQPQQNGVFLQEQQKELEIQNHLPQQQQVIDQQNILLQKQQQEQQLLLQQNEKDLQEQFLLKQRQQKELEAQRLLHQQRQKELDEQKFLQQQRQKELDEQRRIQLQKQKELDEQRILQQQRQKELEAQRFLQQQQKQKELEEQRLLNQRRQKELEEQRYLQRQKELEEQRILQQQQRQKELEEQRRLQAQRQKELEEKRILQQQKQREQEEQQRLIRLQQQKQKEQEEQRLFRLQQQKLKEQEEQRLFRLQQQKQKEQEEQRLLRLQQQKEQEEQRLLRLQQQKELEEQRTLQRQQGQQRLVQQQQQQQEQQRLLQKQKFQRQKQENVQKQQQFQLLQHQLQNQQQIPQQLLQQQQFNQQVLQQQNGHKLPSNDQLNLIPQLQKESQPQSNDQLVPHQPPLSVFFKGYEGAAPRIVDVLRELRHSQTINVLDQYFEKMPKVFVGPAGLTPPAGYGKFDLPYLSNLDTNRIERKIDRLPFFVAPLNFIPPPGYAKIPFPAPHVGSVVVSSEANPAMKLVEKEKAPSQDNASGSFPVVGPEIPGLINSLETETTTIRPAIVSTTPSLPQTTAQLRNRRPNNSVYRPQSRKPTSKTRPQTTPKPEEEISQKPEVSKDSENGFRKPFNRFLKRRRPQAKSTTESPIQSQSDSKNLENRQYAVYQNQPSTEIPRQQFYGDRNGENQRINGQFGHQVGAIDRVTPDGEGVVEVQSTPTYTGLYKVPLSSSAEEIEQKPDISQYSDLRYQTFEEGPLPTGSAKTITQELYRPNSLRPGDQQSSGGPIPSKLQPKLDSTTVSSELIYQQNFQDRPQTTVLSQNSDVRPTSSFVSTTVQKEVESDQLIPVHPTPNLGFVRQDGAGGIPESHVTELPKTEEPFTPGSVTVSGEQRSTLYGGVDDVYTSAFAEISKHHHIPRPTEPSRRQHSKSSDTPPAPEIVPHLRVPFAESEDQNTQEFETTTELKPAQNNEEVPQNQYVPAGTPNDQYTTSFSGASRNQENSGLSDTTSSPVRPTAPGAGKDRYTIIYTGVTRNQHGADSSQSSERQDLPRGSDNPNNPTPPGATRTRYTTNYNDISRNQYSSDEQSKPSAAVVAQDKYTTTYTDVIRNQQLSDFSQSSRNPIEPTAPGVTQDKHGITFTDTSRNQHASDFSQSSGEPINPTAPGVAQDKYTVTYTDISRNHQGSDFPADSSRPTSPGADNVRYTPAYKEVTRSQHESGFSDISGGQVNPIGSGVSNFKYSDADVTRNQYTSDTPDISGIPIIPPPSDVNQEQSSADFSGNSNSEKTLTLLRNSNEQQQSGFSALYGINAPEASANPQNLPSRTDAPQGYITVTQGSNNNEYPRIVQPNYGPITPETIVEVSENPTTPTHKLEQVSEDAVQINDEKQTEGQGQIFGDNLSNTHRLKIPNPSIVRVRTRVRGKQRGQVNFAASQSTTPSPIVRSRGENKYNENPEPEYSTKANNLREYQPVKTSKYNQYRGLKKPVRTTTEPSAEVEQKTNVYTIRPQRRPSNPSTVSTKRIRRPTTPAPTVETSTEGYSFSTVGTYSQPEEAYLSPSGVSNDVYYEHTSLSPVRQKYRKQFGTPEQKSDFVGGFGSTAFPSTVQAQPSNVEGEYSEVSVVKDLTPAAIVPQENREVLPQEYPDWNPAESGIDVSGIVLTTVRTPTYEEQSETEEPKKSQDSKKAFDPDLEKKSGRRRVRIRVHKRPHENFETAESQNLRTVANVLVPPTSTYKPIDESNIHQLAKNTDFSFGGQKLFGLRSREYFRKRLNLTTTDKNEADQKTTDVKDKEVDEPIKDQKEEQTLTHAEPTEKVTNPKFRGFLKKIEKTQKAELDSAPAVTSDDNGAKNEGSKFVRTKYRGYVRKVVKQIGVNKEQGTEGNFSEEKDKSEINHEDVESHTRKQFKVNYGGFNQTGRFNGTKHRTFVRYVKKNKIRTQPTETSLEPEVHHTEEQEYHETSESHTEHPDQEQVQKSEIESTEQTKVTSTEAKEIEVPVTEYSTQNTHQPEVQQTILPETPQTQRSDFVQTKQSEEHTEQTEETDTDQTETTITEQPEIQTQPIVIQTTQEPEFTQILENLFQTSHQQQSQEAEVTESQEPQQTEVPQRQESESPQTVKSKVYQNLRPANQRPQYSGFLRTKESGSHLSTAEQSEFQENNQKPIRPKYGKISGFGITGGEKLEEGKKRYYSDRQTEFGSNRATTERHEYQKKQNRPIRPKYGKTSGFGASGSEKFEEEKNANEQNSDQQTKTKNFHTFEVRKYSRSKTRENAFSPLSKNRYTTSEKTETTSTTKEYSNESEESEELTTATEETSVTKTEPFLEVSTSSKIETTPTESDVKTTLAFEADSSEDDSETTKHDDFGSHSTTTEAIAKSPETETIGNDAKDTTTFGKPENSAETETVGNYAKDTTIFGKLENSAETETVGNYAKDTTTSGKLETTTETKTERLTTLFQTTNFETEETFTESKTEEDATTERNEGHNTETQPNLYPFSKGSFSFDETEKFTGTKNRAHVRNITADIIENTASFSAPGVERNTELHVNPLAADDKLTATTELHAVTNKKTEETTTQFKAVETTTDSLDNVEMDSTVTTEAVTISKIPKLVKTSTTTKISHETEICYKGKCIRTKAENPDDDLKLLVESANIMKIEKTKT